MAAGNKYRNSGVRGISTDRGFTDEVVENNGIPIVSGGGPSDRALISSGKAQGPVTTTKDGTRVSTSGVISTPGLESYDFLKSAYGANYQALRVNISSTEKNAKICINGIESSGMEGNPNSAGNTPTYEVLSGPQLLTPRVYTVKANNKTSKDTYKVYSTKGTTAADVKPLVFDDFEAIGLDEEIKIGNGIPLGFDKIEEQLIKSNPILGEVVYVNYNFYVEKNGKLLNIESINNFGVMFIVDLPFSFGAGEEIIEPPAEKLYSIKISTELSKDNDITYTTSWGAKGELLEEDDLLLKYKPSVKGEIPYVDFFSNGISQTTHDITYSVIEPNNRSPKTNKCLDKRVELQLGETSVSIKTSKINIVSAPSKPSLVVDLTNVEINISSKEDVKIPYRSTNSDEVIYTLGKTTRSLSKSGSLLLTNSDFYNGVGNYTIYLQPVSKSNGSGDSVRINVNVINKEYLPGPDITIINFPNTIKGADFQGYNVPFEISWQSVNTNYIEIYAGGKIEKNQYLGKFGPTTKANFIVEDVLKKMYASSTESKGYRDIEEIQLSLLPYNLEGDSVTLGKHEKINIIFDKGDLTLRRDNVISDLRNSFVSVLDNTIFDEPTNPFLSHYLHLGEGKNELIATYAVDTETLSEFKFDEERNKNVKINEEKALVLKLYEPLPSQISKNDKLWISKIQSIPIIDQITIVDDITKECKPLTPNFTLDVGDDIGYQILDDLVASGSVTSNEVVGQFISSSEFSLDNLDINFVTSSTQLNEDASGTYVESNENYEIDWKGFVKYSSAKERVANFFYKVQLIESYETKYNGLVSGSLIDFGSGTSTQITGSVTSSIAIQNESKRTLEKINNVKKGFDSFEKFLYTSSSIDGITYPGAGGNALSSSSDVSSWYSSLYENASSYDESNSSRFVNNLPQHLQDDNNSSDFILFFDMIGQHFDVIYSHIKASSQSKKSEHKFERGINSELIYHMLESLGFDADMGVKSQLLWEYAFGKNSDGTQASEMSGKDRQQEIWRRILNNLPYLLKTKGTKRAIHAAMSCYGVPASLLTIMEFGGPQDVSSESAATDFTFEDRTSSINISGSSSIIVPWKEYSSTFPNAVEVRVNTNQKQDQQIISASNWSLDIIKNTGSLASVKLTVGEESASTALTPLFNEEYTQIVVSRESGSASDNFNLYVKEGFQGRIRNEVSTTLTTTTKAWDSGSELYIGGNTLTASLDEFRLWTSPLSESVVTNHTLLPDAIDGNHVSSSTDDLILRLDFEYPKDRNSDTEIKNVSVINTYEPFATASNFLSVSEYPYQYQPYERTVTAKVPQTGFSFGNKVRFETQTLESNLNYRSRATKKSYDQSPIDSNKLGLFFSPIKEINMDIMKSLGSFSIDDYIGDPSDDYKDSYTKLKNLRNYYFDRYNLNFQEYIQLVRYIDKSLFTTLESLIPSRAKVISGLLIEPHILERSKLELKPTTAQNNQYNSEVDTQEDISITSDNHMILASITSSQEVSLVSNTNTFNAEVTASDDVIVTSSYDVYESEVTASDDINQTGFITVNSGSDMGGISISVDAQFTGSVQGAYDSTAYQQIGMGAESLSRLGFGLYGKDSHSIRTRLDKNNNFVKDRVKVFLLKESYSEDVPQNINSSDESLGREFVSITKYKQFVNILPFTGSDGSETTDPVVAGNIVQVTPLDGNFETHYSNVGDLTSGLENSFFNGSSQTSKTTLDGGSHVVTFTTNPNTLRVSDSGRGSGEPILEVD